MHTDQLSDFLKLTARLMELHDENPFKIKSLNNAAFQLDKMNQTLDSYTIAELEAIPGIGKSIAAKIDDIQKTGSTAELKDLLKKTPEGVLEMMKIKGIGPKKVAALWKELDIESPGELLYACNENRLVELKGFGTKTQQAIAEQIQFMFNNRDLYFYYMIEDEATKILEVLKEKNPGKKLSFCGDLARKCEVLREAEFLLEQGINANEEEYSKAFGIPVKFYFEEKTSFEKTLFTKSASVEHLAQLRNYGWKENEAFESAEKTYRKIGLSCIPIEAREGLDEILLAKTKAFDDVIQNEDIKGIIHCHSTYSDGKNTLSEMSTAAKQLGYEYMAICDHSQSAYYAGGLKEDRVLKQWEEIDKINSKTNDFKVFKGIESDILNDGSLDYPKELLEGFDVVVASVHQHFKMNEEQATHRIIKAIENPFTTILGHLTGRLLLSRKGYPVNHKKIIDACAANKVIMELNAHPFRLDIDWRWIGYCMEKGVMISINPDAHEINGFRDIVYGVNVARKGLLNRDSCFNAMNLQQITKWLKEKKN